MPSTQLNETQNADRALSADELQKMDAYWRAAIISARE